MSSGDRAISKIKHTETSSTSFWPLFWVSMAFRMAGILSPSNFTAAESQTSWIELSIGWKSMVVEMESRRGKDFLRVAPGKEGIFLALGRERPDSTYRQRRHQ